jgi:hypothetical protein
LALNAPALKNCLDTIHALAVNKQAGVNTVEYNRNLLNLIEIQAKNTLGILK